MATDQMTLFETAGFVAELRKQFKVGDRITWRRQGLGLCVGHVVGVYETQLRARRDGVKKFSPPHQVKYHHAKKVNL